mgnify:CR=1 FL=1
MFSFVASGAAPSDYFVIERLAGLSDRQWKSVLSWMLGVAGTRRVLAEEQYQWIAPCSAFYPERNLPVATPVWPVSYPPSVLEITSDSNNSSRLRPDYIAARMQPIGNIEFALVESKGTSSCLSKMQRCRSAWTKQARNGIVRLNGSVERISRHLVVATRCNPNGVRERSRRIQVRAWNSRSNDSTSAADQATLLEVLSAHYFGLCRNLGLHSNLRSLRLAILLRKKSISKLRDKSAQLRDELAQLRDELAQLQKEADQEIERRNVSRRPDYRDADFSIEHDMGAVDIQLAPQAIMIIRALRSGDEPDKLFGSLSQTLHQLNKWFDEKVRQYQEDKDVAVDRSGIVVNTSRVRVSGDL